MISPLIPSSIGLAVNFSESIKSSFTSLPENRLIDSLKMIAKLMDEGIVRALDYRYSIKRFWFRNLSTCIRLTKVHILNHNEEDLSCSPCSSHRIPL